GVASNARVPLEGVGAPDEKRHPGLAQRADSLEVELAGSWIQPRLRGGACQHHELLGSSVALDAPGPPRDGHARSPRRASLAVGSRRRLKPVKMAEPVPLPTKRAGMHLAR